MNRIRLEILGRVQGVGFRYACYKQARALGVKGWVRNSGNDRVEVVAEGAPSALTALSAWCRHGPPCAVVERVISTPEPASGGFASFDIVRDDYD